MVIDKDVELSNYAFYYFYAFIISILILIFLYDVGRNAITYHGKFFFYYVVVSLSAIYFTLVFIFNAKNVKNCWYAADFLKHLSKPLGLKWEMRDMQHFVKDGAIVIANHQSSLDLLGMFQFWRIMGKATVIAKKELFYFWPFGLCAWLAGVVFIDRKNAAQAYTILTEAANLLLKDKTKIFFFPEGTRNATANKTKKLMPFKKGAFKLAISCQVPIVPVVYSPYYFIDCKRRFFGQGKVIIKALPAIPTTNLTEKDIGDLMEKANKTMQKAFEELFDEIVSTLPEEQSFKSKEFNFL